MVSAPEASQKPHLLSQGVPRGRALGYNGGRATPDVPRVEILSLLLLLYYEKWDGYKINRSFSEFDGGIRCTPINIILATCNKMVDYQKNCTCQILLMYKPQDASC